MQYVVISVKVPDGADPQFYENDLLITNVYLFPKIKEILRAANALKIGPIILSLVEPPSRQKES